MPLVVTLRTLVAVVWVGLAVAAFFAWSRPRSLTSSGVEILAFAIPDAALVGERVVTFGAVRGGDGAAGPFCADSSRVQPLPSDAS